MADIRELLLQDHMGRSLFRLPNWGRLGSRLKLALRRLVVITAIPALHPFYRAIYRLHVWHAVRVLERIPGTRAIYVTRGVATGDIIPGVSDVDLVVLGDWVDDRHIHAMNVLRGLSRLSPLYDASLWQHAHTIESMRTLYETDFYHQFRFDQGRGWRLLRGEDFVGALAPVAADRVAGGYYMDIRNWWGAFTESAFGEGVTARDGIFRHSLAYKAAAEILNKCNSLESGKPDASRKLAIERALKIQTGSDLEILHSLKRGEQTRHLRYEGDIQNDTLHLLLRNIESFHSRLDRVPPFQHWSGQPLKVDAPPSEILKTPAAQVQALEIVAHVKSRWPGYRNAFLLPSVSFFTLDDLMLLLEIDPAQLPTASQVRELVRVHVAARPRLRQRVALLLLLRQGAYQVEAVSLLELWHLIICPAANPDVFTLLTRSEFVIDGQARCVPPENPQWSAYASFLLNEEITVRRHALANPAGGPPLDQLELLRNLWRQLQLETVQRSVDSGSPVIPLTPSAVQRAARASGISEVEVLDEFELAYRLALEGGEPNLDGLLPAVLNLLKQFQ